MPPVSRQIANEEDFIARYLAPLAADCPGAFGLADDAALIAVPASEELVVTTDAVAAGVHFFADDAPGDIAWKALAVNVSDLAGKGATPLAYQMALSLPFLPEPAWMEGFVAGLREAQRAFGIRLSGGDTDRRPGPLTITLTAMGTVPTGKMVRRGSAAAGDRLYVTGTLGDGALGLLVRSGDPRAGAWGLSPEARAHLLNRYLRPSPRLELGSVLRTFAAAAMDVSDGLAKDLGRMCKTSGAGAAVECARLPLSAPARAVVEREPNLFERILAGGDDYELLIAVPKALAVTFETQCRDTGVAVTAIGEMRTGSDVLFLGSGGKPFQLTRSGWDHFGT